MIALLVLAAVYTAGVVCDGVATIVLLNRQAQLTQEVCAMQHQHGCVP